MACLELLFLYVVFHISMLNFWHFIDCLHSLTYHLIMCTCFLLNLLQLLKSKCICSLLLFSDFLSLSLLKHFLNWDFPLLIYLDLLNRLLSYFFLMIDSFISYLISFDLLLVKVFFSNKRPFLGLKSLLDKWGLDRWLLDVNFYNNRLFWWLHN